MPDVQPDQADELDEIFANLRATKVYDEAHPFGGLVVTGVEEAKQKLRAYGLTQRRIELGAIIFADLPASVKDALKPYIKERYQALAADIEFGQLAQPPQEQDNE